jgi:hypothetical protein
VKPLNRLGKLTLAELQSPCSANMRTKHEESVNKWLRYHHHPTQSAKQKTVTLDVWTTRSTYVVATYLRSGTFMQRFCKTSFCQEQLLALLL